MQEFVAASAVIGAAPSPDDRVIAAFGHPSDTSLTVNVTESGAGPEFGVTVSVATSFGVVVVPLVTETVTDCKVLCVVWFTTVA